MKKLYYTILATAAALTTASCVDLLNTAPENQIASENMWTTPELALKGMNGLYETFYNRKQSNGTQVRSENLDGLNKYGIEALGFCTDYYANNYPIYLLYNQAKRANDWQLAHEWRFCYTIVHAANDAVTNLHKAGLDAPTYERDNEMIFAIQYDEESGYCDNIQQAVGARDTYGGWDEVKPASDFVDYYQNDDGTEFKWSQVTGLENWDQLTPRQRAVFFCRDGLKSNAKLASQKTQAIGICGQDIFDRYYLDNGNEARIKAAYDKRDPRLKQTIVTPYEPVDCFTAGLNGDENMIGKQLRWPLYLQGTSGGDFWLDKRTSAYYCYRKYVRFLKGELIDRQRCYTDFPLIRYTDVILQWAEALIELNEFTPAKNLIDQVRARAHMPGITIGGLDAMREAVRYERRVEFPVEAVNFFDEVRWGTYKETKFQGQDVHGGQSWWGDNTVEYAWYWDDCLWPWSVPQGELQRNASLTTRPGWVY
jgi:susD family